MLPVLTTCTINTVELLSNYVPVPKFRCCCSTGGGSRAVRTVFARVSPEGKGHFQLCTEFFINSFQAVVPVGIQFERYM